MGSLSGESYFVGHGTVNDVEAYQVESIPHFARGELDVCIGNGAKVAMLVVGTYHLSLPFGLVLELNN